MKCFFPKREVFNKKYYILLLFMIIEIITINRMSSLSVKNDLKSDILKNYSIRNNSNISSITENKKLLGSLEVALCELRIDEVKVILHAVKGSALSIGAVSLKLMCKRIEKLNPFEMEACSNEILQELRTVFNELCEELEKYRKIRRQTVVERD